MLTPIQRKILQLLSEHTRGLTVREIVEENDKETQGIQVEELNSTLLNLAVLRLLRSEEESGHKKWLITLEGLGAIGAVENWPWP